MYVNRVLIHCLALLAASVLVTCREPVTKPDYDSVRDLESRFYLNPVTGSATGISATAATLSGSVSTGGATVTERGIYLSTSTSVTGTIFQASGSGSGTFTVTVSNLTPGTQYVFRAFAKNTQGEVISTQSQPFSTLAAAAPTVTTGAVTSITSTGATVAGNVTAAGSSTVTARGVCYGTSQNPTISGTCTPANTTGTGSFSVQLAGLSAGVTYFVRAYATNSAGTAYGSNETFPTAAAAPTVTDIDGNVYPTVQIGTQVWMAANLRTTRYRTGATITNVTNATTWSGLTTGAWAHYDNAAANETLYGKLYNWYAVTDSRNICPTGWHVPSDAEWTVLSTFLATDVGFKMKATSGWGGTGNGSNASGFNGLPGGTRFTDGTFNDVGRYGFFWSSSEGNSVVAWFRYLYRANRDLVRGNLDKRDGFSVRCVRD
jgi:uncharacterized protein (TIGR02145 family)